MRLPSSVANSVQAGQGDGVQFCLRNGKRPAVCLLVLSVAYCLIKRLKSKNASGHMFNDWHLDMGEGLTFFFFFPPELYSVLVVPQAFSCDVDICGRLLKHTGIYQREQNPWRKHVKILYLRKFGCILKMLPLLCGTYML